jgi:hypothetical protein
MNPGLVTVGQPANLRLGRLRHGQVITDSGVYGICERIKEFDPTLYVVLQEGDDRPWVVMEETHTGECRFVARYAELDGRILEHLRYIKNVPFAERFKKLEAQIEAENAELGKPDEESMDYLAWEMQKALIESGMSDPKWVKSFRPTKHLRAQGKKMD